MKVQVCTAVVVMAALLVGAAQGKPPHRFWMEFLRQVTSDVCGDTLCWPEGESCFKELKDNEIQTEEQLTEAKTNLTECAETVGATEADFSTLTLEDVQRAPRRRGPRPAGQAFKVVMFLRKYNVGREHVRDMLECLMERNGELPRLRACLAESQTDAGDETQTEATE